MSYETQMMQLARFATRAHGALNEVVFLSGNKDILLVFADGLVLPTQSSMDRSDIRFQALSDEYSTYLEAYKSIGLGNTPAYDLLAFGYGGTGSTCFSTFLTTTGFRRTNVENISAPLRLRRDGSEVRGTGQGDLIQWEDGSETPSVGKHTKKEQMQTSSAPANSVVSKATLKEREDRIAAGLCPKCGNKVAPTNRNCPSCRINLAFAREHLDQW